jgi:hypothetical protein
MKEQEITSGQITKIHIAKNQLKLTDEQYREVLSGFVDKNGVPCNSCKSLSADQANVLLSIFTKFGFKEMRKYKKSKYAQYAGRDPKFASVAQLELIDSSWYYNKHVREKTDEALNNFIKNIVKVNHISFLLKRDVKKIIMAIKSL